MDGFPHALAPKLAAAGCRRPEQAATNIGLLAPDGRSRSSLEIFLPTLLTALGRVPDPDLALNNLERFAHKVLDRHFLLGLFRDNPRILHLALTVFGSSQFLSDILVRQPQLFEWLLEPGVVQRPKSKEELSDETGRTVRAAPTLDRKWSALRRHKSQEILRIGLQDLVGRQNLVGITEELSNLADVSLEAAYRFCRAELVRRHGVPRGDAGGRECPFAILGMGKLGGRELNFSSDIDLIFVYDEEGETAGADGGGRIANQEFFRKLGEMLVRGMSESSPEGHLYRVDLRLRPEGRSGAIAGSLRSCELYYESWGQTWERQALIKARPVAGDPGLGEAFLRTVAPFVYRQSLDLTALDEIRAMKDRINLSVAQDQRARRNVKLGYGGIREIEFLVQGIQLLHGGKNVWVREPNTLRALHRLAGQGVLADSDYEALVRAYTCLRRLEHRLQILHDRQTHTLPEDPQEVQSLARRMGYHPPEHPDPGAALLRDYERHTTAVRELYDSFLRTTRPEAERSAAPPPDDVALFFASDLPAEQIRGRVASVGFEDVERALRNLQLMREGQSSARYTPEMRRALAEAAPPLLAALTLAPDPDLALTTFERFVAGVAARTTFTRLLAETPGLVELLVRLFGTSEFLSATLLRQPELLDAFLAPEPAARHGRDRLVRDLRQAVEAAEPGSARLDALRRRKKAEELRIGLADILDRSDVGETQQSLTSLAEACLEVALGAAEQDLTARFGRPVPAGFSIVGMGKLGGAELGYGSDLDLLFVYRDQGQTTGPARISHPEYFSKLADRVSKLLASITQEGAAYRVDARLRPGGQKGEVALALEGFESYLSRQADLWERQAYIKARPVAGDPGVGEAFLALAHRFVYESPDPPDLAERILAMRQRIEAERVGQAGKATHVKLGSGGILEIEFLVQYLQLAHGRAHPALRTPGTLAALAALGETGLLPAADAAALTASYRFLRRVETRLRIVADLSVNTLPSAPAKLERLAKRMGYAPSPDASAQARFLADYGAHTGRVHEIFERVFHAAGGPALRNGGATC
jgi:glutamate-ammonia-ligase adenylyltransferase